MGQLKDMPTFQNIEFPVWEVVTPHTGHSVSMRSLTVAQEEVLKTSATTPVKTLAIINQIIYECMQEKGTKPFDTLENFERNITMADREALIYGLIIASYGETQDFSITCPACGKNYEIKNASLTENVEIKLYNNNESMIEKKVTITLPVSKYNAVLKMPTLYDERLFASSKGVGSDVLRKADDYIIVKSLDIPAKDDEDRKSVV